MKGIKRNKIGFESDTMNAGVMCMSETMFYDKWRDKLQPVLDIKAEEFEHLGFKADRDEIWNEVVTRIHRESPHEPVRFHRFVNELMKMSVNDYINRLRIESLKGPDWLSGNEPLNLDEFDGKST